MQILFALDKYGYENFTFVILEIFDYLDLEILKEKEDYWYKRIKPSYNIQDILLPFTGINHYRYGKKLTLKLKEKIQKSYKVE